MDKEGHHKSLARYFIDAKVPSADREKQVLLADGSHHVDPGRTDQ